MVGNRAVTREIEIEMDGAGRDQRDPAHEAAEPPRVQGMAIRGPATIRWHISYTSQTLRRIFGDGPSRMIQTRRRGHYSESEHQCGRGSVR